jgi:cytidylate kinase
LAQRLGGVPVIDSGLWFRALGLVVNSLGLSGSNEQVVNNLLPKLTFIPGVDHSGRCGMKVVLNHNPSLDPLSYDFSANELAQPFAGRLASTVAPYQAVRELMLSKQRELASQGAVTAGRAQGAEVFNNEFQDKTTQPVVRVLLHAAPEVRAQRRLAQLERSEGFAEASVSYQDVLTDILQRDFRDRTRTHGKLLTVDEARLRGYLVIDNGSSCSDGVGLTPDEIVTQIVAELRKRRLLLGE